MSDVSNFARDIEAAAEGEAIVGIVIGDYGGWRSAEDVGIPKDKVGALLTWEEARKMLDYEYDTGFGGAECHAIYAWTESRVLLVAEYDGSTRLTSVPRAPVSCMPGMA